MQVPDYNDLRDPIIEETRKAGAELARAAGYDLHVLCEHLRDCERQHPERLSPRKSDPLNLNFGKVE